MRQIDNIGNEGIQELTIPLPDGDLFVQVRFLSVVEIWQMSVNYNGISYNGIKMSCGTLHMRSANFPFDFIVTDESGSGIDPYKQDDFTIGRNILYLVEANEMEEIRGQEVS